MISGCGIDIEELNRFTKHLKCFSHSSFVNLVLTEKEKSNFNTHGVSLCFPLAFSCKEAMFKALGDSWATSPMNWKDIEIIFTDTPHEKAFSIHLTGFAQKIFNSMEQPEIHADYQIYDKFVFFEVILLNVCPE
jgi:phosphopantetheine--protein transferase-like protein